jgi:hypothetical protein
MCIVRKIVWIAACALTLICGAARAQEAAPMPVPPTPVQVAPAPAEATAPPPTSQTPPPELSPEERRRLERHERMVAELVRAIQREGSGSFSQERYDAYFKRIVAGAMLTGFGLAALAAGIFCALSDVGASLHGIEENNTLSDGSDEGSSSGSSSGWVPPTVIWPLVGTGTAAVLIGIPLLVNGQHGRSRQQLIRRKDEILAPFNPSAPRVTVSLFGDRERGAGGLSLRVEF